MKVIEEEREEVLWIRIYCRASMALLSGWCVFSGFPHPVTCSGPGQLGRRETGSGTGRDGAGTIHKIFPPSPCNSGAPESKTVMNTALDMNLFIVLPRGQKL